MAKVTSVRIEDHSEEYIEEMKQKVKGFLISIGETASSASADVVASIPLVKTGRLKNSINWAVGNQWGAGDVPLCLPEEDTVYIGTNVEYAPYHELGTSRGIPARHFIQYGAQSNWNDGLKTQLENYLKNG